MTGLPRLTNMKLRADAVYLLRALRTCKVTSIGARARHSVGAVDADEAVVIVVVRVDGRGDLHPVFGAHVAGIKQLVELQHWQHMLNLARGARDAAASARLPVASGMPGRVSSSIFGIMSVRKPLHGFKDPSLPGCMPMVPPVYMMRTLACCCDMIALLLPEFGGEDCDAMARGLPARDVMV